MSSTLRSRSRSQSQSQEPSSLGDFTSVWRLLEQQKSKPVANTTVLERHESNDTSQFTTLGDFTPVWKHLSGAQHSHSDPSNDSETTPLPLAKIVKLNSIPTLGQSDKGIMTLPLYDINDSNDSNDSNNSNNSNNSNSNNSNNRNNNKNNKNSKNSNNVRVRVRVLDHSYKGNVPTDLVIEVEEQSPFSSPLPATSRISTKKTVRFHDDYLPSFPSALSHSVVPPISATGIHVFVDNSNIFHGLETFLRLNSPDLLRLRRKPKLNYSILFDHLHRNRLVARKILVASEPLIQPLTHAYNEGYECSVLRRIPLKKPHSSSSDSDTERPRKFSAEQGVDELIQLKMLESILDSPFPQTIVLATGDGKAAQFSSGGFYAAVLRALARGWNVEIVSWARCLSSVYLGNEVKKAARNGGGVLEVRLLDLIGGQLME